MAENSTAMPNISSVTADHEIYEHFQNKCIKNTLGLSVFGYKLRHSHAMIMMALKNVVRIKNDGKN